MLGTVIQLFSLTEQRSNGLVGLGEQEPKRKTSTPHLMQQVIVSNRKPWLRGSRHEAKESLPIAVQGL